MLRRLVREIVDDRVNGLAAEIAFFGVLGLFPAMLMLASALGWVDAVIGGDVADEARQAVTRGLGQVLSGDAANLVREVERLFTDQAGGVFTTATLGALWALSRAFGALIVALDVAYDLPERRTWVRQRLIGLGIGVGTVLAVALVLAMLVVGPLLGGGYAVADRLGLGGAFGFAWTWTRWPAAFVLLVAWITMVFAVGPAHVTNWRVHVPGAVLSAIGWLVVSGGFRLYLALAADGNPVYGVLGGGLALLLWVYALSLVLLVGAEVNGVLLERDA